MMLYWSTFSLMFLINLAVYICYLYIQGCENKEIPFPPSLIYHEPSQKIEIVTLLNLSAVYNPLLR